MTRSAVTLTVRKGRSSCAGTIIWQGTLAAAGHLDYAFGQEMFLSTTAAAGFNAVVTNAGGATVQYEIYGWGFGVVFAVPAGGLEELRLIDSPQDELDPAGDGTAWFGSSGVGRAGVEVCRSQQPVLG